MNKTCIVTGGAKRIGKELCRKLAASGWNIVIHYNQSHQEAKELKAEIVKMGVKAKTFKASFPLENEKQYKKILEEIFSELGPVDLLINNASEFQYDCPKSVSNKNLISAYNCNCVTPILFTRALFDINKNNSKKSLVINILDQKISNPNPDFFSYTLSKYALYQATKLMALEMASTLRIVSISPGITLQSEHQSKINFDRGHKKTPLGRSSLPEDIASAVIWLEANPAITGIDLIVDGGQHLAPLNRDVMFTV